MKRLKSCRIRGGMKFYYLPEDKFIGQRVALGKYEPYETELMLEQIKQGDVVVDVGANIGYDSLLFAKKTGDKGKVYAFEPEPTNFLILKKNIEENKIKNIEAINAAVGSKEGKMKLYKSENNLGDHRMFANKTKANDWVEVKVVTLDKIIDEKVRFLKIDTQGFEVAVIEGAEKIIKKNKPTLFFEYWRWGYKTAGLDEKKMKNFLSEVYGEKICFIDEYINIYFRDTWKNIDKKCRVAEEAYVNLLIKEKFGIKETLEGYQKFKIKKWLKRLMGRPAT